MDLRTRKNEFSLEKEKKLWKVGDLKLMTVDEFNDRIDESMNDSENGRLIKSSDLKSHIEKWT